MGLNHKKPRFNRKENLKINKEASLNALIRSRKSIGEKENKKHREKLVKELI